MNIERLNALSPDEARAAFLRCCGSRRWAEAMTSRRPFGSPADLFDAADSVWNNLDRADWLEAFAAHPRIGAKRCQEPLSTMVPDTFSLAEQAGVAGAGDEVLRAWADGNRGYEERFGYIFIVCATGKTAVAMLQLLRDRLQNTPDAEFAIAAAEQAKITRLRLEKL